MALEQATEPATAGPNGPAAQPPAQFSDPTAVLFRNGLPSLTVPLPSDEILKRLDAAARRGNLAGFKNHASEYLFEVEAYTQPFDHRLLAKAAGADGGTRLSFRPRMFRKAPLIFAISIVFTIWPGLPLTHSMLVTYFRWYHWSSAITAAWYLPLTVLPLLWWVPRAIRKSRAGAVEAAKEQILRLKDLLNGTLTQG